MKNSHVLFIICFLFCTSGISAQTFKIENGIAFSRMNTKGLEGSDIDLYPKGITSYQMSLGADYCQNKWFYLSSAIGYLEKGGKTDISVKDQIQSISEKYTLQYVTMNTLFNIHIDNQKESYHLGIGPRFDIKMRERGGFSGNLPENNASLMNEWPSAKSIVYGLKCEAGVKLKLDKNWQIGLNASYLPSFTATHASSYGLKLQDQTFSLGLVLEYRLLK